jgi:DNA-binding transcriptional ArsR family regulator
MQHHDPALRPSAAFEITTAKHQRAYFHPVRMKILNFLSAERLTVSQTAARLKVHPANITHHFRILRSAGLIRLAEKRDIGRTIEKYYEAAAQVFDVRPSPGEIKHVGRQVLTVLRDDLSGNIARLKSDDSDALVGFLFSAKIDATTYSKFAGRLQELITEFEAADQQDGDLYSLCLSLYPQRIDYGPMRYYELKRPERARAVK